MQHKRIPIMAKKKTKKKVAKKKTAKGKQKNAGKALTAEKREQMFQVFFKHGTLQSVVKELVVCQATAIKYRKVDNWDHRVEEIKWKATAKIDNNAANRLSENMKLVLFAKRTLMKEIQAEGIDSSRKVADLDKLIRLEEFLSGSPDSRPEVKTDTIQDIGELKELLQQKKDQLKNFK